MCVRVVYETTWKKSKYRTHTHIDKEKDKILTFSQIDSNISLQHGEFFRFDRKISLFSLHFLWHEIKINVECLAHLLTRKYAHTHTYMYRQTLLFSAHVINITAHRTYVVNVVRTSITSILRCPCLSFEHTHTHASAHSFSRSLTLCVPFGHSSPETEWEGERESTSHLISVFTNVVSDTRTSTHSAARIYMLCTHWATTYEHTYHSTIARTAAHIGIHMCIHICDIRFTLNFVCLHKNVCALTNVYSLHVCVCVLEVHRSFIFYTGYNSTTKFLRSLSMWKSDDMYATSVYCSFFFSFFCFFGFGCHCHCCCCVLRL